MPPASGGAKQRILALAQPPRCKTIGPYTRNKGNRAVTVSLDGEIRDGRRYMQVRVYFKISTPCQIVYHTNFLRFIERGRTNYLRPLGTNQQARLEETRNDAPGFAFVVRSTTIDSLKPAFLDGLLDIVTVPQEVRGTSVGLPQECRRGDDLLVSARVRVAFISGGKAQRIPRSEACYGRAQINLPFVHALTLQRPDEINALAFCCDIVKSEFAGATRCSRFTIQLGDCSRRGALIRDDHCHCGLIHRCQALGRKFLHLPQSWLPTPRPTQALADASAPSQKASITTGLQAQLTASFAS